MRLTLSIATWNNREMLADCLRSIERPAADLATETWVVDNASTDGTAEMVRSEFPWVRLLCNRRPMGFSANHNQVLRRAESPYVLLLNDDTVILGDALAHTVQFMENHPEAGAAGCTLLKPDGAAERISQRFPHPLDPIFPRLRRKVDPRRETGDPTEAVEVDRWSGASLMIRREALDQVGLLDERFDPAYGEDTDLCYRIRGAGWRIYRLPGAKVVHYRGQTARREFSDHARRLQEAKFLWYRKHRSRIALFVYRLAVLAASFVQLVACLPLLLLSRRRENALDRIGRLGSRIGATVARSSRTADRMKEESHADKG